MEFFLFNFILLPSTSIQIAFYCVLFVGMAPCGAQPSSTDKMTFIRNPNMHMQHKCQQRQKTTTIERSKSRFVVEHK